MCFLYDENAGNTRFELAGDGFLHLKAQRKKINELIKVQNLHDNIAYFYEIMEFKRNFALLELREKKELNPQNFTSQIGWAVCDSSVIEKTLPFLNELGLGKLVLFYSDFSQHNIKLDFGRFERILKNSCQQCGRYEMMKISLLELYELENCVRLDFKGDDFSTLSSDELLIVGPEGGFSQSEREKIKRSVGLKCQNILRSQTAIISALAKILA